MQISFDDAKRDKTLAERGLDFANAAAVFAGVHFTSEDRRQDYGEIRFITAGLLYERMWLWSGPCAAQIAASFP
ncbi:BrnT family toxin [Pseudomonas sp. MWU16-30317]|uniref:BrnT family toxin n=1 Tax=Pseudomonas sp. MWU16-30317 TaxID=2878095 RepID=UPI001CF9C8BB|nr:BrnT family toxin [Pseudomonas sp. MWU16-30317]